MIVLYVIIRFMVRVSLRIFYKEYTVNGRERLPRKGPLLAVGNHPNTLMDPLVIGCIMRQQVGFMGNGSLFRNKPLARLLRFFHVIPVYRKQDMLPGETIDNEEHFQAARDYLAKGGTILIFPEGTSYAEKRLRQLRTGAARIALSFERSRDFQGGLQIVPSALNYSASTRFRSRLRVDVGTPIRVADYRELYEQDPAEAVRALTDAIGGQIEERMVVLEDPEQERLHTQVSRLLKEEWIPRMGQQALLAEKQLADRIRGLKAAAPEALQRLQLKLNQWFATVDRLRLTEGFFMQRFRNMNTRLLWLLHGLLLVAGLPVFAFGAVTSYFPYWLPAWAAPKISDEVEYHAPTMMVIGMFLFPIWYALLVTAGAILGLHGWWLLGLGLALPLSGAFALYYVKVWDRFRSLGSLMRIKGRKQGLLETLVAQREALLLELQGKLLA